MAYFLEILMHMATIISSIIFGLDGFFFVGVLIIAVIIASIEHQQNRWLPWQKLAATHNLAFITGGLLGKVRVTGSYKSHKLLLEAYEGSNKSHVSTRITISAANPAPANLILRDKYILNISLTPKDVANIFTPDNLSFSWREDIKTALNGQSLIYESIELETDLQRLQHIFDWLVELSEAYPKILALGGEAIPILQTIARTYDWARPLVTGLLRDIAGETTRRLSQDRNTRFCPNCLTRCAAHKVPLGWWQSATYYGCRSCGQSRRFLAGRVAVAVIDNQSSVERSQQHGALYINWVTRRQLFDFSEVQIVQATDEEVERFAVQAGNDTDPARQDRYSQMRCFIAPGCRLSANTHRILQRTFGAVIAADEKNEEPPTTRSQSRYLEINSLVTATERSEGEFSRTAS